jgi:hypothetical protein
MRIIVFYLISVIVLVQYTNCTSISSRSSRKDKVVGQVVCRNHCARASDRREKERVMYSTSLIHHLLVRACVRVVDLQEQVFDIFYYKHFRPLYQLSINYKSVYGLTRKRQRHIHTNNRDRDRYNISANNNNNKEMKCESTTTR